MVDKIYIVTAHFGSWDGSFWITIGIFEGKEKSDEIADKWREFFRVSKIKIDRIPEGVDEDQIDWDEIGITYKEISQFEKIVIDEYVLDKDNYPFNGYGRSKECQSLISQWDRDYKLNKLI